MLEYSLLCYVLLLLLYLIISVIISCLVYDIFFYADSEKKIKNHATYILKTMTQG